MAPLRRETQLIVTLLFGQAFFLGAATALLYIAANTLFLVDFEPEFLPYVYIATGIVVSILFFGLTALQRHWSPVRFIAVLMIFEGLVYLVTRLALTLATARWVPIFLMILFPLGVQLMVIILGGQVGRLLDVRQTKRLYPIVFSGATIGFIAGSLGSPFLVTLLTRVANLLFVAGVAMILALIVFLITVRRFPDRFLSQRQPGSSNRGDRSLGQLVKRHYTANLFIYQMISAIGSQLVIYIFLVQADARFLDEAALARFFGNFGGFRNVVNLIFLLALAGPLVSRFGIGFGLAANPVVVGGLIAVMGVATLFIPVVGVVMFWLATITYVADILLTDGTTSASLKTAYQALAPRDRPAIETAVEGIGVPVALGISGILLLIFNRMSGLSLVYVIVFSGLVCLFWWASAALVYRRYAVELMRNLSRRLLNETELSLADPSSLAAVTKLLNSPKLGEVRLALNLLDRDAPELLPPHLLALAKRDDPILQTEALGWIERGQIEQALPGVETCLQASTDPAVRGAALRAWCAIREAEAIEDTLGFLDSSETHVQLGAMVGLLRYGGISGTLQAGIRLMSLENDPDPQQRAFAAKVIGQVGRRNFYHPLLPLLTDPETSVRLAALTAAGQVRHPRLVPPIIDNLADSVTRSTAMAALIEGGEIILPLVEKALTGRAGYDPETARRLVRACGQIKGRAVIDLLKQHLDYPDILTQQQLLLALHRCRYRAADSDRVPIEAALRTSARHGFRILAAKQNLGQSNELILLHDALGHELNQVRQRIFLLLSFIYNPRAMLGAEERLAHGGQADRAMAIETLDVTLNGSQKTLILPLVDESLSLAQRVKQLARQFTVDKTTSDGPLNEIIGDTDIWRDSWTRACAIYAGGKLELKDLVERVEKALESSAVPVRETAAWALYVLATDKFYQHAAALADDPDPQVAALARQWLK